jgi:hypothetical protein
VSYFHWLGKDAEAYEEALAYRKAYYNERRGQSPVEADGFVTVHVHPRLKLNAN